MKHFALIIPALLLTACGSNDKPDASGSFESMTEITVSSEANGKIKSFDITEGDNLKVGQFLGYIDTTQLHLSKLQLLKSRTSVKSNRPDVNKQVAFLKEQLKKQEYEKARITRLVNDGAAPQKQLDDINSAITVLRSQIDAQLSTLHNSVNSVDAQSSSIDIQIAAIDDMIEKSKIVSPIDGVVISKYSEANEFSAVGKPLYKVADLNRMCLRAYFTSEYLAKIQLGQTVNVTLRYGDDSDFQYEGKIVWISSKNEFTPQSIQTNDTRSDLVYAVKIEVINDGKIKIGAYGEVNL